MVDLQHVVAVRQQVGVTHVGALHEVTLGLQVRSERGADRAADACRARRVADPAHVWRQERSTMDQFNAMTACLTEQII